jgi:hypothetical protein
MNTLIRIVMTVLLLALTLLIAACAQIAIVSAPKKLAVVERTSAAEQADKVFWDAFRGGNYNEIDAVLKQLTAAYLGSPGDAKTAAHIGWAHIWRFAERVREEPLSATIVDDAMLARRYFDEAVRLDPADARYRGFLAASMLSEGTIHQDERLKRTGYYAMKEAVEAWPEFNLFTRGYVMSQLPSDNKHYLEAIEDQWANLDKCIGARLDRHNPNYAPFMTRETNVGVKRACWNSWIAPHNFEGFFLNLGDMLVKANDPTTARQIYAQARLSKEYGNWPYREVLERRIVDADANVERFRSPKAGDKERRMMIESSFACSGCHQE